LPISNPIGIYQNDDHTVAKRTVSLVTGGLVFHMVTKWQLTVVWSTFQCVLSGILTPPVHIIEQQVENDLFIFFSYHIAWSDINRLFHHKWVLRCLQIKKREETAKKTFSSSLRICWFTDWFANIFFLRSLWEFVFLIHTKLMIASNDETKSKRESFFLRWW